MWDCLLGIGFLLASGVYQVQSYLCDVEQVEICKLDIMAFENEKFPFYGGNEKELDETCRSINESMECLLDFIYNCYEKPECDGDCSIAADMIFRVWNNTGVPVLYNQLCFPESPYRHTYLEHYKCLEKVSDEYTMCHNTSQESQQHVVTLYEDPEAHLNATCCFFSWYQDCYSNATMNTCGANATFVISFALHLLMGHIVSQFCNPVTYCDRPPLPEMPEIDSGACSIYTYSMISFAIIFLSVQYMFKKRLSL